MAMRDLLPNTAGHYGHPVPANGKPTLVQDGIMSHQWAARAEYYPEAGWFTVVNAFEQASVREGLDRQFRPANPSPEFLAQAEKDHPDWLEHMAEADDE
jgi:hypothetical protein